MKLNKDILKTKNKLLFLAAISLLILLVIIVYGTPLCNATFEGKVIDADTKQAIEGAVVVVSWTEERGTPTGGTQRLKEVKETLTDKNGTWKLRGPRGTSDDFLVNVYSILTMLTGAHYTNPPQFIIFKPGYCSYPQGFGIAACKERMRPYGVGNGEATELPKLMSREDRVLAQAIWPSLLGGDKASKKKVKIFIRLLNEEAKNIGLQVDPTLQEIENEK